MDNQVLTDSEIKQIQDICFNDPVRACAIAQIIADTCQLVSCSVYAELEGKSTRTIQHQAKDLVGLTIENRKFISLIQ